MALTPPPTPSLLPLGPVGPAGEGRELPLTTIRRSLRSLAQIKGALENAHYFDGCFSHSALSGRQGRGCSPGKAPPLPSPERKRRPGGEGRYPSR